ncbi:hypothetical protein BWI17_03250 [Betaproteobacteria bacterium GR16-43]|nr:hypothetical protein BWI17_03250 [Betaproteobacteria bacterium GR16-43]
MRHWPALLVAAALPLALAAHGAERLYAASVSGYSASSSNEVGAGILYTIDPVTAAATRVASIRVGGKDSVGITGLAFHPATGVLYGITAGLSPHIPHSLVTIDPANGDATVIGPLGLAGSDISFDSDNKLYMWIPSLRQVGIVNTKTGVVTPLGKPGEATQTGGLAIGLKNEILVAAAGASGTLDVVDPDTGVMKPGVAIVNAPYANGINSLTFSNRGVLYAVNSNMGAPATTRLISIDTTTGAVTNIGALPPDTDGLTFRTISAMGLPAETNWTPFLVALGVVISLVVIVFTVVRPRKA